MFFGLEFRFPRSNDRNFKDYFDGFYFYIRSYILEFFANSAQWKIKKRIKGGSNRDQKSVTPFEPLS